MKTEFLSHFYKDLDSLSNKAAKTALIRVIQNVEAANSVIEIPNMKKLAGHKSAYRIRIGDFRLGIFVEKKKIIFARIMHRKQIYRSFP